MIMLNPDSKRNDFESWFSAGLKKALPVSDQFVDQLLDRLERQKAQQLLKYNTVQSRTFGNWMSILILAAFAALLYPTMRVEIPAFIDCLFGGIMQLILQPSLESFAIPAAVVCVAAIILWNLAEMLSLE